MHDKLTDYAQAFAAWEARLFLNTHPTDQRALDYYGQICAQSRCEDNYACLPESQYSSCRWSWIDDPWPWEAAANDPVTPRPPATPCRPCRPQTVQRQRRA